MKIHTKHTHHITHRVTLTQTEVENILRKALDEQIQPDGAVRSFNFVWSQESYDSGIGKRPQIEVVMTDDLAGLPVAAKA